MTIQYDNLNTQISAVGSPSNIDFTLNSKGTGSVKFNTGGGTQFQIQDLTSTTTTITARGGVSGGNAQFGLSGTGNTDFIQYTLGTGAFRFLTNGVGQDQMRITHTASAVNYVQVTGAATTGNPEISVQGSDSAISLNLASKSTNPINLRVNGATQFQVVNGGATIANRFTVQGAAAGSHPVIAATGSDSNINITLTTKGTGRVQFGTHTATADTAISGYIEILDSGGTVRRLAVIT